MYSQILYNDGYNGTISIISTNHRPNSIMGSSTESKLK